jgi:hypothetical protein
MKSLLIGTPQTRRERGVAEGCATRRFFGAQKCPMGIPRQFCHATSEVKAPCNRVKLTYFPLILVSINHDRIDDCANGGFCFCTDEGALRRSDALFLAPVDDRRCFRRPKTSPSRGQINTVPDANAKGRKRNNRCSIIVILPHPDKEMFTSASIGRTARPLLASRGSLIRVRTCVGAVPKIAPSRQVHAHPRSDRAQQVPLVGGFQCPCFELSAVFRWLLWC